MLKPVCSLAPIKDPAGDICFKGEQSDSVLELSPSGGVIIIKMIEIFNLVEVNKPRYQSQNYVKK